VGGRDQLRRYLEQRREAGEQDLLLDGMPVEEVLRILGARTAGGATGVERAEPRPLAGPPAQPTADWRAMLAAAEQRAAAPRSLPGGGITSPREPVAHTTDIPPALRPPAVTRGADLERPTGRPGPAALPDATDDAGGTAARRDQVERWPAGLRVGHTGTDLFGGPMSALQTLDDVAQAVACCTQCPLYATATQAVPGEGSPTASLVCVGEAPGATEDATGRPFVGQAGKLLDKILAAIQLCREDVFICNVLKHRPPGNRNPLPDEVTACSPYLVRQLDIIRPQVVVAFGTFAAQTLLQTRESIGKLRGAVHRYYGVPLIVTYHPAALLRNPAWKRPTWEDVQYARRILDGTGV
jgi:uracil-DNA glycosylase